MSSTGEASRSWRGWNARRIGRLASAHLARGNLDLAAEYADLAIHRWGMLSGTELNRAGAALVLARARDRSGHLETAVEVLTAAEQVVEELAEGRRSEGDVEVLAKLRIQHADVLRRLHEFAAAGSLFDRTIVTLEDAQPTHPSALGAALNGRGIVAKDSRRFGEAKSYYLRALEVVKPLADAGMVATIEHNLGGLAHAERRYLAGAEHARRAVAGHRALYGSAHPLVAGDLGVLGANLTGALDLPAARDALQQALALFTQHFSDDHYEVAVILHNLAAIDALEGDTATAEQRCLQALHMKARFLGEGHPEIAALHESLASIRSRGRIGTYDESPTWRHALTAVGRRRTQIQRTCPRRDQGRSQATS